MTIHRGPGSRHESVYLAIMRAGTTGITVLEIARLLHLNGEAVRERVDVLSAAGKIDWMGGPYGPNDRRTRWHVT